MEAVKITFRFWGLIILKALQFSVLFGEIRGEATSILKGLLLNLLAFWGIGSISNQPIEIIPIIYWVGTLMLGRFLLGLIYFPARFYTEKKREANRLTFKDIEIKPYKFPKGSGYGVGIRLVSDKQRNSYVTDVLAKIGSVKRGSSEMLNKEFQYRVQLPVLIGSGSHFEKGNGILNRGDKNTFADVSVIPIASWNNEKAWVLSDNGLGACVDLEAEKSYRLTMSIDGTANTGGGGFKLEGCGIWCDLIFQNNSRGGKEVSLRVYSRRPNYEE